MAREALQQKPSVDEARVVIEEASRESTGRRKSVKSVVRSIAEAAMEHVLRKHLQMTRIFPSLIL